MSLFDEVLPQVVRIIESSPITAYLESATIIRDLHGKVRLMLEFVKNEKVQDNLPPNWKTVKTELESQLKTSLGLYWGGKIWREAKRKDKAFQAVRDTIKDKRYPWFPSNTSNQFTWYKLERHFSKSSWQPNNKQPPWKLEGPDTPAIISFYSFKGGVGRTTTAAAIALLLARAGKRVLVLDLDLEAPGLGSILLENIPPSSEGIVDYLLEYQLSKIRPLRGLDDYVTDQNNPDLINNGELIRVMTAGQLNENYLEKLARLDFENFVSETQNPLLELLHHAHKEYNLDFILIDLRAGLHDIGGLSLNGLSHLDILFGLETKQNWQGLEIVLKVLGQAESRQNVLLVHAMNPLPLYDPTGKAQSIFKNKSYTLFKDYYFTQDETVPDIDDPDAPYGLPIDYDPTLININNLSDVVKTLTYPLGGYNQLARIIGTYLGRETI